MFFDQLTDKEKKLVGQCEAYVDNGAPGLPGHSLMILVAKLVRLPKVEHPQKGLTVFISGPYTNGDQVQNTRDAIDAADYAFDLGLMPFVPHLAAFWDFCHKHNYQKWMDYDSVWLMRSDCVWRIPGDSSGADQEVELANKLGIPVFYDFADLKKWADNQEK